MVHTLQKIYFRKNTVPTPSCQLGHLNSTPCMTIGDIIIPPLDVFQFLRLEQWSWTVPRPVLVERHPLDMFGKLFHYRTSNILNDIKDHSTSSRTRNKWNRGNIKSRQGDPTRVRAHTPQLSLSPSHYFLSDLMENTTSKSL
jgi:hypothetical protein